MYSFVYSGSMAAVGALVKIAGILLVMCTRREAEIYNCSFYVYINASSVQQKSSGLKFSKSGTGSHVTYSCHHNSSRFSFPICVHSWHFSIFHSLQTITPRIY